MISTCSVTGIVEEIRNSYAGVVPIGHLFLKEEKTTKEKQKTEDNWFESKNMHFKMPSPIDDYTYWDWVYVLDAIKQEHCYEIL